MEKIIDAQLDSQHGIAGLLAGIVLILCLHLLFRVGFFVFEMFKAKSESSDKQISEISLALQQNTQAVRELRIQIGILERELAEVHKYKVDSQKLFAAVKIIAGKRWVEIRKAMESESLPK